MITLSIKRVYFHLFAWSIFLLFLVLSAEDQSSPSIESIDLFKHIVPITGFLALSSYFSLFIHSRLFQQRKYAIFGVAFFGAPILWSFLFVQTIYHLLGGQLHSGYLQNYINFLSVSAFAIALRYAKRGIVNQFFLQETKAKLLEAELNALKSQLNPHFLFNTLNNIYGTNLTHPEKGSEMILSLSDLFRYQLEIQKKPFIPLSHEIQFLKDYLELEKLRLTEKNQILFDVSIESDTLLVAPLLFLPFVENALKYGTHPNRESEIRISLKATSEKLIFSIKNPIFHDKKVVSTQTGLENVKRRLQLLYPKKHTLQINDRIADYYEIQLELDL